MSSSRTPDFARLAADYDALRPADDHWAEVADALIREGGLLAGRVLDVGCGTGRLLAAVAARGGKAWGVDASPAMLAVARGNVPRTVGLRDGRAEALPFRDGWFERVAYVLAVHLLDRPAAFAEARRVLARGGRVAIATFDAEHFERFHLNRFFPSIARVDRERFPTREQLRAELTGAGFAAPRFVALHQEVPLAREVVLERVRGRNISTFDLLDEEEYAAGLALAEAELPAVVATSRDHLLAFADAA